MSMVHADPTVVHAPAKHPCAVCESTDCRCAPERWDADERAEWLEAEKADEREQRGHW